MHVYTCQVVKVRKLEIFLFEFAKVGDFARTNSGTFILSSNIQILTEIVNMLSFKSFK